MVRKRSILATLTILVWLAVTPLVTADENAEQAPASETEKAEFVAYYLHGNLRCGTCRKLEAYSKEAITGAFPDELASKILVWREVNTDEDEHKHFVEDFQLVTKALVLVELRNGEVVRHKDLKLIWQLVGSKDGFIKYVRDETREFMGQD